MILRTKSYVVLQNIPLHLELPIVSYGKKNNFKCLFSKNSEETQALCDQVVHLLGVYFGCDKQRNDQLSVLNDRTVFIAGDHLLSLDEGEQLNQVIKSLDESFADLVPESLKKLSKEAFELISEELLGMKVSVDQVGECPPIVSNCLVSCESVGENLSHYVSFEFESYTHFPGIESNHQLLDMFREIANQTLGVVNNKLAGVPIYSRIGLPYVMDPYDVKKNTIKTSYYYPKVVFHSADKKLIVTFGYLSIDNELPKVGWDVQKVSGLEIL